MTFLQPKKIHWKTSLLCAVPFLPKPLAPAAAAPAAAAAAITGQPVHFAATTGIHTTCMMF